MNRAMLLREKLGKLPLILAHTGVTITQEGASAYVRCDATGKPTTVNLPYISDNAPDDLMDAIEGFLDHEVAHLLFTDFSLTQKSKSLGFGALHGLLEDTCVEAQMAKKFPGTRANLSETGRFYLRQAVSPALQDAMKAANRGNRPDVRRRRSQPAGKHRGPAESGAADPPSGNGDEQQAEGAAAGQPAESAGSRAGQPGAGTGEGSFPGLDAAPKFDDIMASSGDNAAALRAAAAQVAPGGADDMHRGEGIPGKGMVASGSSIFFRDIHKIMRNSFGELLPTPLALGGASVRRWLFQGLRPWQHHRP